MPQPDDHSEGPSTLPPPDLNPLLNPLLGQNMGRWAEVYFTSAPEKREQAVLDLLRELQAENPASAAVPPVSEEVSRPVAKPAAQIVEVRAARVTCLACGRENPASHRFCGMCGTALAGQGAPVDLDVAHLPVPDFGVADFRAAGLNVADLNSNNPNSDDLNSEDLNGADIPVEDRRVEYPPQSALAPLVSSNVTRSVASDKPGSESQFVAPENALFVSPLRESSLRESPLRGQESPQLPRAREDTYYADHTGGLLDPAPASRSYRVHLVIALAFVLAALGYLTWRSMRAADTSQSAPQIPPAVMTQPAAESGTSSPTPQTSSTVDTSTIDTSDRSSAASNRAGVASHSAAEASRHPAGAKTDTASRAASTSAIPGKNPQAESLAGNGGEELAMAQRYLNGTAGQGRDSAEAAKWLWKAIGKHNGEASLRLSELYLKGDGVTKNCDQARVLLDAAAIRGVPGAAERLRNLQAFGCS